MNLIKMILLGLTLALPVGYWLVQQRTLHRERALLQNETLALHVLENRLQEARKAFADYDKALMEENNRRTLLLTESMKVDGQLKEVSPESLWVEPPVVWPQWNGNSPYIWLEKESLGTMPVPVFDKKGQLRPEVGMVMTVDPEKIKRLNDYLPELLRDYQEELVDTAEEVPDPFTEYDDDEPRVAVRISPDPTQTEHYRELFEKAVLETFGQQRGDIVLEIATSWLNKQFNPDMLPRTYAVIRRPDGTYNLRIRRGEMNVASIGGGIRLEDYLPVPLVPWVHEQLNRE